MGLVWTLVFAGWGLDDLAGFFAHPARAGLVVAGTLFFAFVALSSLAVQPFRKGERPVGRQHWFMAFMAALVFFIAWFLPFADRRSLLTLPEAEALRYCGLALYAGGASLRLAALRTLGKQFSGYVTVQNDHQLVQHGIYSLIRHPMYLAVLLIMPGNALVFRSWLAIPLLPLSLVFTLYRIQQEEKLLGEHFGAEFEAYRHQTWRLVPYLY